MFTYKKAVFFDLDNTLLPLDENRFIQMYFQRLGSFFSAFGLNPNRIVEIILAGTEAMRKNNAQETNDTVFWRTLTDLEPEFVPLMKTHIKTFYTQEYPAIKVTAIPDPSIPDVIHHLKKQGLHLFLTTNPLFPALATHQRVQWAGLTVTDFEFITTMENACASKPNPAYFQSILTSFNLNAHDVMMIGNDWIEDTAAEAVGIETIILTNHASKTPPVGTKARSMTREEFSKEVLVFKR